MLVNESDPTYLGVDLGTKRTVYNPDPTSIWCSIDTNGLYAAKDRTYPSDVDTGSVSEDLSVQLSLQQKNPMMGFKK